jgi:hypothetical protein
LKVSTGFGLGANDSVWAAFRVWADAIPSTVLLALGVSGSTNNRKVCSISSTQFSAFTVDNAGTLVISSSGVGVSTGQWYDIVVELGGGAGDKAISYNGTRSFNPTTNTLTTAPNEFSLGISNAGAGPLDGRMAYVGLWSGVPTADDRAAARELHPLRVSPATLIDAWDLNTSLVGYKGNTLTATGSPSVIDGPRILLPFGRARVVVPAAAVGGGSNPRRNRVACIL